jgi:rhodanese-related sulfurtransferase
VSDAYPEIEIEEARTRLDEFRIVDVREPAEFGGPLGHVAGAELLPLRGVVDAAADLRGGKPLLLVCRSGNRSGKACAGLVEVGVPAPTNLIGGMIAWNRAGLPVQRERAASPTAWLEILASWLAVFAGDGEEGARERIAALLEGLGASADTVAPAHLAPLLEALQEQLAAGSPPADLDVVVAALRADAEALAGGS